LLEKEDILV